MAPALVIRLELEARPMMYVEAMFEGEAARLFETLHANDALREFLRVANELCEAP